MNEKLYVLRNSLIVRVYNKWWIEVVDAPFHLRDKIGLKESLLIRDLEKGFTPININNTLYSLRGGTLGEGFDLIEEYNPIIYIQEEMEL